MKYSFVILAVIGFALAAPEGDSKPEEVKNAEEFIKTCKDEIGISDENANKIKVGDFSVRDEKAQCFTHCFFQKAGFVNDKGELQPDIMINKLSHKPDEKNNVLEELVNKCVKEKGENDCETSFRVYECYRGGVPYKA